MKVYLDSTEMKPDLDKMVAHFDKAVALRDSGEVNKNVANDVLAELDAARAIATSIAVGLDTLAGAIRMIVTPLDKLGALLDSTEESLPE